MWTKILGTKKPNVFIAEMDGELAGFIGYGAPRDKEMPFDCELRAINILEKFHRKGIGRALVSRAINKLRNAGHKHVYLWVAQDNINAVSFYEHLGFLKTEHQKTERDIKEICYSLVLEK